MQKSRILWKLRALSRLWSLNIPLNYPTKDIFPQKCEHKKLVLVKNNNIIRQADSRTPVILKSSYQSSDPFRRKVKSCPKPCKLYLLTIVGQKGKLPKILGCNLKTVIIPWWVPLVRNFDPEITFDIKCVKINSGQKLFHYFSTSSVLEYNMSL